MGVTTKGLPWPAPTAPVSSGAADIRALAEAIDPKLPLANELGYTQQTTNSAIGATTEALAPGLVQAPPITVDGATIILIEFYSPIVIAPALAGERIMLYLFQDGASIGILSNVTNAAAVASGVPVYVARRITPAAGTRTYSIRAACSNGNGTVVGGPGGVGAYQPMFVRITRV